LYKEEKGRLPRALRAEQDIVVRFFGSQAAIVKIQAGTEEQIAEYLLTRRKPKLTIRRFGNQQENPSQEGG